jgi:predicted RecA/RadA family phage recombinase
MNGTKVYKNNSVITLPVPAEGITVGQPIAIGGFFGFSQLTCSAENAEGELFTLDRTGVFAVEVKATSTDIGIGDDVYFDDNATPKFGNASGRLIGYAMGEVEAGETKVIQVSVEILPVTTKAEAIEDAGGADA